MPATRFLQPEFVNFLVGVYNVLKFETLRTIRMLFLKNLNCLIALMNLAHTINGAHNELVKVPSEKKIRLETKCDQENVPNELTAFFAYFQILTHLLDCVRCNLLHPIEEHLELVEGLFLSLFSSMNLSKRLLCWLDLALLTACRLLAFVPMMV